jgi:hypothetical protein
MTIGRDSHAKWQSFINQRSACQDSECPRSGWLMLFHVYGQAERPQVLAVGNKSNVAKNYAVEQQ